MSAQPQETSATPKPISFLTLEIETQRRQLEIAMSIVDACRLANDSMLIPMFASPAEPDEEQGRESQEDEIERNDRPAFPPEPDLEGSLAMVWIILNGVSAQLEELMQKNFEDVVATRRQNACEDVQKNAKSETSE